MKLNSSKKWDQKFKEEWWVFFLFFLLCFSIALLICNLGYTPTYNWELPVQFCIAHRQLPSSFYSLRALWVHTTNLTDFSEKREGSVWDTVLQNLNSVEVLCFCILKGFWVWRNQWFKSAMIISILWPWALKTGQDDILQCIYKKSRSLVLYTKALCEWAENSSYFTFRKKYDEVVCLNG